MPRAPIVAAPTFDAAQYGLLTAVEARYTDPGPEWLNGVRYEALCGLGGTVFDQCITGSAADGTTDISKESTVENRWFYHGPITAYAEFDCSPVGFSDEQLRAKATDGLSRTEQWQVEAAIWSGQRRIGTNAQGPGDLVARLASNEELTQSGLGPTIFTQTAATVIGPTGTPLDLVEASQRLESAFRACYGDGLGVLHVPVTLGLMGWRSNMFKTDGPILRTQTGHKVALGAGYTGFGPGAALNGGDAPPANSAWIYMTGPVAMYRSQVQVLGTFADSFDRATNTIKYIAERTYVPMWMGCCHFAALVSTGGIVTGQPQSAF